MYVLKTAWRPLIDSLRYKPFEQTDSQDICILPLLELLSELKMESLKLTSKLGKGAGGVEADWSLDSIRENAGKDSLAQGAVTDGFL